MFEEYVIGDNESFNLLEKKTLASGSTTTTFSNLSGDSTLVYKVMLNLQIVASGSDVKLGVRFNSINTGYDSMEDYDGTAAGGGTVGDGTYYQIVRSTHGLTTNINGIGYIFPNKTYNPGTYKSGFGTFMLYVPGTAILKMNTGFNWGNANEITTMTFYTIGSGSMNGNIRLSKMAPTWGD